jgi:hypothetical protein
MSGREQSKVANRQTTEIVVDLADLRKVSKSGCKRAKLTRTV